ncbi:dynein axonemal intermediate chain 3 [Brachyistius frenatus]|uniref:dynein axonemal intermediate chain 3 n=1 Tax=Brachyistius frenatus TaxID=100188 RepID=UPI0037E7BFBD
MAPKKKKDSRSRSRSKGKGKGKKTQSPAPQGKHGHPDDIFPLVLTSATQQLFGCCADEDVTRENPYKLLQKDDIIQDIKTRAAVSDFSPVKQIVLDYPEEEMLLVFDRDFTYDQSFYLVLTPEAKDRLTNPPEPETPEVFEEEVIKTPEPRKWICLGSDWEIDEESVKETREKICRKVRLRRKPGGPCFFSDLNAGDTDDSHVQCPSYEDNRFSIKLMQRDCGTQAVPKLQSSSTQTQWKFQKNASTQYEPRELSEEEKESILQSESLNDFLKLVTPRVLLALQQEEIQNVFINDCNALEAGATARDWDVSEELLLHLTFTDLNYTRGKNISCINWHPTIHGVMALALTEKNRGHDASPITRPASIVFYSFSNPSHPQLLLECPEDIFAFEFCPSNPNIIVGGCVNGQVVLWDLSAHVVYLQDPEDNKKNNTTVVRYRAVSAFETSHKGPVTDVQWLPQTFEVTRTGVAVENKDNLSVQVVTCSPDGSVIFWDVRMQTQLNQSLPERKPDVDQKLMTRYSIPETFKHLNRTWKPLFKITLPMINTSGNYAPLKFSFEHYKCDGNTENSEAANENDHVKVIPDYSQLRAPSAGAVKTLENVNTKLFIATEDGEIVYTDWKQEKDETGRLRSPKPIFCFSGYHLRVNTMQRSPFFKDIVLTTGGWTFAIWKEGVKGGPILRSPISEQHYTVGCWSPSRPAVFFIGKDDGSMEVWNLLINASKPAQVHAHITNAWIACIKPWTCSLQTTQQHFLAVADHLGVLSVFKIPRTYHIPAKKEMLSVTRYFDLRTEMLKDLLEREERWAVEKKEAEELKKKVEPVKPVMTQQEEEDQDWKEYQDYLKLEESILKGMGLWPPAANTKDT